MLLHNIFSCCASSLLVEGPDRNSLESRWVPAVASKPKFIADYIEVFLLGIWELSAIRHQSPTRLIVKLSLCCVYHQRHSNYTSPGFFLELCKVRPSRCASRSSY